MLLKGNCTRSVRTVLTLVSVGFLTLASNGWASPFADSDLHSVNDTVSPSERPLTATKQMARGNDYLFGRGVEQDSKMAVYWFQQAANAGDPQAQFELGYLYEAGIGASKNLKLAAHWYQLAAHGGSIDAQANLGMLYFWGSGVAENKELAAQLLREAAEKGSGRAAFRLGYMYSVGAGVPLDKSLAEQWYQKGAKQHDPQSEYELGVLYFYGDEHKIDLHKAEGLLRSSATSGYVPAMHTLGLLLVRHPEFAENAGEGALLLEESASAGVFKSSEMLGIIARDGNGLPVDQKAAYFHFKVAALQGGPDAEKILAADLGNLAASLGPEIISALDAQAQGWYQEHRTVLQFVNPLANGKSKYPAYSFAAPKSGEHELQLIPAVPAGPLSIDPGSAPDTAQDKAKRKPNPPS